MTRLNKTQEREDFLVSQLKSGMRFQIVEKDKLPKKEVEKEEGISIMGVKDFKFKKEDILVIDSVSDNQVQFHVQRKGEDKSEGKEVIKFTFTKLIFIQRFEPITDLANVIENVIVVTRGYINDTLPLPKQ